MAVGGKKRCGADVIFSLHLCLLLSSTWLATCDNQLSGVGIELFGPPVWSATMQKRQHVFDLTDFGAVGDGVTDNTRAFQNALYAVSGVSHIGGGQLYVPPGTFLTGSFNLTSNMTLYLAKDAVILGSKDYNKWPLISPLPSYGRGREMPGRRHSSLLQGEHLVDVIITGENGTIDGQGGQWWERARNKSLTHTRGSLIEILWTAGVTVTNVTLLNSPFWTVHPTYCSNIVIMGVTIYAPADAPNTDGIVPDSCTNVRISDVVVMTGGDGIALKSGWDEYGISYNMSASDIYISDAKIRAPRGAGIAIGSEMSGGVSHIDVSGCEISGSKYGISVRTGQGRGGYVSDVEFRNIIFDNVEIAIGFSAEVEEHPDEGYDEGAWPVVESIRIEDVDGWDVGEAAELIGTEKIRFEHLMLAQVNIRLRVGGSGYNCAFIEGVAYDCTPEPCADLLHRWDGGGEGRVGRGVGEGEL